MKLSDNEKIIDFVSNIYKKNNISYQNFIFSSKDSCKEKILILKYGNSKNQQQYINDAIAKGIRGLVTDSKTSIGNIKSNVPILKISNLNKKLNAFLDHLYSYPTRDMLKIGVTGTNGKTSTCHFLAQFLSKLFPRKNIGIITSEGNGIYPKLSSTMRTTPENHLLYWEYHKMKQKNVKILIVECSSQGLHQGRLNSHSFDVSILTNLDGDHIDYHKNYENYVQSKLLLLQMTTKYMFINKSLNTLKILNNNAKKILYRHDSNTKYSKNPLVPEDLFIKFAKVFAPDRKKNIGNIISKLKSIQGRYHFLFGKKREIYLIDYAHTSSSFLDICKYAKKIVSTSLCNMKLLIIFGCGGDRDKEKRITMANYAMKYADYIIVTDDNPRSEDPIKIINQISKSLTEKYNYEIINNRKSAIRRSLDFARSNYLILLLGKGNESKIIYKNKEIYHNDIKYVESLIK